MMLLIYRPFDVGDFVYAGGVDGKVSHMSLVNTTIRTFDNQIIICLLYTSPSPRDRQKSRMPSSA